jgi:hypothetical protein
MAESKKVPDSVVRVHTYNELEHYARAFAAGHLNLLMLCGNPGIGKSQCFRGALGSKVGWINGSASAFGIYLLAFEYRNQPIVLDDIDGLYRDRHGIRLLKALCQTDTVKTLCWQTGAVTRDPQGVPRLFSTTSKVAIIANQWHALNADVSALEDRGHCLHFVPTTLEVHRQAAGWFWDQEVFDFVATYLHLIQQHSLRTYVLAWELKKAGLNWRETVLSRFLQGATLEVAKLKSNPSCATEKDRVRAFVAAGLGCRATYFNCSKKLRPPVGEPLIRLVRSSPPEPARLSDDILGRLRRRFGFLGNG